MVLKGKGEEILYIRVGRELEAVPFSRVGVGLIEHVLNMFGTRERGREGRHHQQVRQPSLVPRSAYPLCTRTHTRSLRVTYGVMARYAYPFSTCSRISLYSFRTCLCVFLLSILEPIGSSLRDTKPSILLSHQKNKYIRHPVLTRSKPVLHPSIVPCSQLSQHDKACVDTLPHFTRGELVGLHIIKLLIGGITL